MKYSEEFEKPDYTKGPYPMHHSVGGKSMVWAPKAQPRTTGDILKVDTDDMPIGLSYGPGGNKDGDFGPYIQRIGEGLPNSFSLDFTNNLRFSGGAIHPHTGLMLFSLALNLRPKAIIETGTANGYSTLYLAKALEVWGEGKVYTVDTKADIAHPDIRSNPYVECIVDLGHNAIERMGKQGMEFQMGFLDSFKRQAYHEFRVLDPLLPEGGIVAFHDTQFLNTGKTLYEEVNKHYSDKYDLMLFTAYPHKDNGHKFFGNADDRGFFVVRKKVTTNPFYNAGDWGTKRWSNSLL